MENQRVYLAKQYAGYVNSVYTLPFRASGFFRYHANDNEIISKPIKNICQGFLFIIIWNIIGFNFLYRLYFFHLEYKPIEYFGVLLFMCSQNIWISNVLFFSQHSGVELSKTCIDIDVLLNVRETQFMRNIAIKIYLFCCISLYLLASITTYAFFSTFKYYNFIAIFSLMIFVTLLQVIYDMALALVTIAFVTLRTRYLNTALMKYAKLNINYFPKYFLFDGIFWQEKFNDLVKFHERANNEDFINSYKLLYSLIDCVQKNFSFIIVFGLIHEIATSFSVTQLVILYIQKKDVQFVILTVNATWFLFTTLCGVLGSQQFDVSHEELQKTKQICTYILLKPYAPMEVIQLSKKILRILETRNTYISLYGIVTPNTKLLLKLISILFVYIIMQFDIAFSTDDTNTMGSLNTTIIN